MKEEYINLFIDKEYPAFIDKYLTTKSLKRLKHISQFCGCDYTNLYSPLFFYSRFDHSLVVAHITWHFTHDKIQTLAALFHDLGTPCFAHTIDYVFGDYMKQETSEKDIIEIIKSDKELCTYLKQDGIKISAFENLACYPILENKSPKLCADRLDGVLGTVYIWLHTNSKEEIKEIYDHIVVLKNEDGKDELGLEELDICLSFVKQIYTYAIELQSNRNKFTMKFISDMVKQAVEKNLISMEELYTKKEEEIITYFEKTPVWHHFQQARKILTSENKPDYYFVSLDSKKRNVIPLVKTKNKITRIDEISEEAKKLYEKYHNYHTEKYSYLKEIKSID